MGMEINITGRLFGELKAERQTRRENGVRYWECLCSCGKITEVAKNALLRGATKSCGCKAHRYMATHGMSYSPEYVCWNSLIQRCINPKDEAYSNYGGRGITVAPQWIQSFEVFFKDTGPRPSVDHQLDRENNNGNYEPGNTRWVLRKVNCRNTRSNVIVEYSGRQVTITEASELSGLNKHTLYSRYNKGWRGTKLFQPVS